jgi:hypothetical protein
MRILIMALTCEAVSCAALINPGLTGAGPASETAFCKRAATCPPLTHMSLSTGGRAKGPTASKASTAFWASECKRLATVTSAAFFSCSAARGLRRASSSMVILASPIS